MLRKEICVQALTFLASTFLATLPVSTVCAEPLAPLPHTGLTQCYNNSGEVISCADTGQDAEYKMELPGLTQDLLIMEMER